MAKVKLDKCDEVLEVYEWSVRERMSALFEVNAVVRAKSYDLDLEQIVGFGAGLGYRGDDNVGAGWTGVCTHMEVIRVETSDTGRSTYHLSIAPTLWLLGQRRGHRIFQHKTVRNVVDAILGEYQIPATWELGEPPLKREYEVQYGETDLAFVSRLLEEAGISYLFERQDAGGQVYSKLVFRDRPEKVPSVATLPYHDQPPTVRGSPFVTDVHLGHEVKPGKTTLRDYDLRNPLFDLTAESAITFGKDEDPEKEYETYSYLPANSLFEVSKDGSTPVADEHGAARSLQDEEKKRAQRYAEADRGAKRYVRFDCNERQIAPGVNFSIDGHGHTEVGSKPLFVVETITEGDLRHWSLRGVAVFTDEVRYRPPRLHPKPRVMGLQTAIVVGPKSGNTAEEPTKTEIHTDEFDRVRVRFHWDREGDFDDNATCWLRVSHAWAGAGFGWQLVPRVGQEVVVDFFEGDPNQPVIVGRLHAMTTVVPRVLPKNMTQSTWRSATSPFSDGRFNEIMMDDDAGKELFFFQAQRDLYKLVKHDETERTYKDRNVVVGAARVSAVAGHDTVQVGKQHLIKLVSVGDLRIQDMGDPSVTPKSTLVDVEDGKIALTTGHATILLQGGNIGIEADGAIRMSSDDSMVVWASNIYLNERPASVSRPSADKKIVDPVKKPDRMLGAIEQLFWTKAVEKQLEQGRVKVSVGDVKTPPKPMRKPDGTITKAYYQWLRKKSPDDELRDMVNPGPAPHYDPINGQAVDRLEADHIVPMLKIVAMDGFFELTTEQQIEVLNLPANFWGLSGEVGGTNQSKGGSDHDEWINERIANGNPFNPTQEALLRKKDKEAQKAIADAIAARRPRK